MRFLLVEDDPTISHTLGAALAEQFYVVDVAEDGQEGLDYTRSFTYDLVILDVSLPRLDGLSLCRQLRREKYTGPILLLTARGETEDKVRGLDAGADDYVVKPCTVPELMARVRALLRRQRSADAPVLEWGFLRLDPSSGQVTYRDRPVKLSPKEYSLLELLLRHPRRLFSRSAILEHLWSLGDFPGEETVKAHIKGLRRKLSLAGARDVVETVYGMGYRLRPGSEQLNEGGEQEAGDASARVRSALDRAWERFSSMIYDRLESLERVAAALGTANLLEADLARAADDAHKLIGSLGPFGLVRGSQLARAIESHLQSLQSQPPAIATVDSQLETQLETQTGSSPSSSTPHFPSLRDRPSYLQPSPVIQQALNQLLGDLRREIQNRQPLGRDRLLIGYIGSDPSWYHSLVAAASQGDAPMEVVMLEEPFTWDALPTSDLPGAIVMPWNDPAQPAVLAALLSLRRRQRDLVTIALVQRNDPAALMDLAQGGWDADWVVDQPIDGLIQALGQYQSDRRTMDRQRVLAINLPSPAVSLLRRCCQQQQWELACASQPQRVCATMAASRPDIIVLSAHGSPWDGVVWTRALRSDIFGGQRIPILVLAEGATSTTVHHLYQAGVASCLLDPLGVDPLIRALQDCLAQSLRPEIFKGWISSQ
ncbi:MAG: response regulator [Oscillatoriales cyanobacterium]|nr:MAG: response regulator [Oscillatoriales cyanobacterium]